MDIDLAALPDDVETLQQLVRSLAAEHDIESHYIVDFEPPIQMIYQVLGRT